MSKGNWYGQTGTNNWFQVYTDPRDEMAARLFEASIGAGVNSDTLGVYAEAAFDAADVFYAEKKRRTEAEAAEAAAALAAKMMGVKP